MPTKGWDHSSGLRNNSTSRACVFLLLIFCWGRGAGSAEEVGSTKEHKDFLAAHARAQKSVAKKSWEEAVEEYTKHAEKHPDDAYRPMALILQGILIRSAMNRGPVARPVFERAVETCGQHALGKGLKNVALSWLARLQMEKIATALKRYYVDQVEYPESLEALAKSNLISLEQALDPWGKPFVYEPRAMTIAPDIRRQKYKLSSSSLRGDSRQTQQAVKDSLVFSQKFLLRGIASTKPYKAVLARPTRPDETFTVTEGMNLGGVKVLRVTRDLVILAHNEKLGVLAL